MPTLLTLLRKTGIIIVAFLHCQFTVSWELENLERVEV